MKKAISAIINGYQKLISPFLGAHCRFRPTCSEYIREAIINHGLVYGGYLAIHRILRCHPLGGSGWDPVPEKDS